MAGSNHNNYDVIIIGSGIGGLTAGAYLVKKGVRVLILEQHRQPGGYLTSFKRKGFTFDGGIQACEDCGMLFSALDDIGVLDRIELKKSLFALASPDNFAPLNSVSDAADFYRGLAKVFPGQTSGINQIIHDIEAFYKVADAFCTLPNPMFRPYKDAISIFPKWLLKHGRNLKTSPRFFSHMKIPFGEYLEQHLSDPNLIRFIRQMIYMGSPAAFALVFYYFVTDYYHPKGGFQAISDALADFITERSGEIRYKTMVEEIIMDGSKASGVRLSDGETINAPFIVSNSDARRTFLQMLPGKASSESFKQQLLNTPLSESIFTIFLGVDIAANDLPTMGCHHVYLFPDYRGSDLVKSIEDETLYTRTPVEISIPSLHHPSMAPEGKTSIILQSWALMDYADEWRSSNGKRTAKYKIFKENVASQIIKNAEMIIPGLTEKILFKSISTPLTCERYTLNSGGATAGWTYNPRLAFNSGAKGMKGYKTPVKNLFLVGHWTMSPGGVPAGLISGKMVSKQILKNL